MGPHPMPRDKDGASPSLDPFSVFHSSEELLFVLLLTFNYSIYNIALLALSVDGFNNCVYRFFLLDHRTWDNYKYILNHKNFKDIYFLFEGETRLF